MTTSKARILIADDSDDLRRGLRNLLESRPGYTVCGKAANGSEAVSKARELNPDLVILDLKMPDMTGFEAARQILEFAPSMPILMFSMHSSSEYLQVARKIGIRGYVQKGSRFDTLFEGLEVLLHGDEFFLLKSSHRFLSKLNFRETTFSPKPPL
jgi:DNA-binding NarL/FixJ family response regulator